MINYYLSEILKMRAKQTLYAIMFIVPFFATSNLEAQQILDFRNPTIINGGTDLQVGTQYRFQNTGVSDFNPIIQLNGSTIVNGSADGTYIEFFFNFALN